MYDDGHETLAYLLANCAVPPIEKARLARLAITDAQTMAFNHSYLMPGLLAEMNKRRGQLSVLLMDLDEFKTVNVRSRGGRRGVARVRRAGAGHHA